MIEEAVQLIKEGDIMQIRPAHDDTFGGCLMIVTEVKKWGVQGYIPIPGLNGESGNAFYRCKYENCVLVGSAMWIRDNGDEKK